MYEEGKLRPPSPAEQEAMYVTLEVIVLSWWEEDSYPVRAGNRRAGEGNALDRAEEPTFAQLREYMTEHGIPEQAKLVYHDCGSHTLALDWSHTDTE